MSFSATAFHSSVIHTSELINFPPRFNQYFNFGSI